jgi:hypothetical protein
MIRFRVDDFRHSGKDTDIFTLDQFKKFDSVMDKHNINYLLGCIPLYANLDDMEWVAENPRIEIALHGINHPRGVSEFKEWETETEIKEKVLFWKNLWEDKTNKEIFSYIPPNNIIDHKTVRALLKAGYTTCFGGPETDQVVVDYALNQGMKFEISEFPYEYGVTKELLERGSIEHVMRECVQRDVWISLHHTWEKNFSNGTYEYLDEYLTKLKPAFEVMIK